MRALLAVALGATVVVGCADGLPASTAPPAGCHARHVNPADPQAWEPDFACTPGATDGGLTQLCPVAHTSQVRPSSSYTSRIKTRQMRDYGYVDAPSAHEEDHLIPLSLGGSPRNPLNLWPQPGNSPNAKDAVENAAHQAVCAGRIELWEAQGRMATDWYGLGRYLSTIR